MLITIRIQIWSVIIFSFNLPSLWLNLQAFSCFNITEIEDQFVTIFISASQKSTLIFGIDISFCIHIGIITAANDLVENYHHVVEADFQSTINFHATHISTAIERTKHGGIWDIIRIEYYTGLNLHSYAIHVSFHLARQS